MGLTIHYRIHSSAATPAEARAQVAQMQHLARELPVQQVDEDILDLEDQQCDMEARRAELQGGNPQQQELFWFLIQATGSIQCPWNSRIHLRVKPTHLVGFTVIPGPGSEPANLGLAQFPAEIPVTYDPKDDRRFEETIRDGYSTTWQFSHRKWQRWCQKQGMGCASPYESRFQETRTVPTKLPRWSWSSFCKTQYASDPACGGIANFLRCHISLITLLDRIAKLPGVKVALNDEGKYGRSYYTDDPTAARPVYTWHRGRYSPSALAKEVGCWNEMLATMLGALRAVGGAAGTGMEAPILSYQNFEELAFQGRRRKEIQPFLEAMKILAERNLHST